MNTVLESPARMPDVQSGTDARHIAIQRVGVRGVRHPLTIAVPGAAPQASIADWEMTVHLPPDEKGTHMSRFMALLEDWRATPLTPSGLQDMAQAMLRLLDARNGRLSVQFPYFIEKTAPVSEVRSLLDYQIRWVFDTRADAPFMLEVQVPVTSLCPCSKAISAYGAHNQRSHITARLWGPGAMDVSLSALIRGIEAQGSCELWGLLKRVDEKYVTERAYENPKFVEDLVRDVATLLKGLPEVTDYEVEAENFESIHNHSAYALVSSR